MIARRVEVTGGALATLDGLMVAAVILALGGAVWAFIVVGLAGLGAGISSYQHGFRGGKLWLALLWVSSLGLAVMTILAIFSVGVLLMPGALAALIAAGVGTWRSATGSATNG